MNYVIVQIVRNSQRMFRTNAHSTATKRQRTMRNAENQLTIMLLLVTVLFLILLLPGFVRYIYFSLVERDTPSKYANAMLFFQITFKFIHNQPWYKFFLVLHKWEQISR